jgi:MSHA pilin protein MshA
LTFQVFTDNLVGKGYNLKEKEKMKSRLNSERGFTLIELVMVIVILGILAAVAIPRFVDLQGSARTSVAHGLTGALAGQITMLHAQYLINAVNYDENVVINSIDTSGINAITGVAGSNAISADVDGVVYTWTYTPNGAAAAARVQENASF